MSEVDDVNDAPEGWEQTTLCQVSDLQSGAGFPLEFQGRSGRKYPFFKVGNLADVQSGELLTDSPDTVDDEIARQLRARIIPPNSVIFAKIGMAIRLNRRRLVGRACCIDNNTMAAIPYPIVEPFYLLRFLETKELMPLATATTVPSLRKSELERIAFSLPPLAEQRRIVAKVEELLARVNAARARLAKVPTLVKRFRQSVLAAACSGRLTEDWRHPTSSDSLSQIEFSAQHHDADDITALDARTLPDIPDSWCWSTLRRAADYIGGYAYQSKRFVTESNNQVLRIGNVRCGYIDLNASPVYISDDDANDTARFRLENDDILVSMTGTRYKRDYGYACLVPISVRKLLLNQRVARLRCTPVCLPKYLHFWLQTDTYRDCFFERETGNVNQGNVGATPLKLGPVALPPLAEQREIVRRVDALFALADKIEARAKSATARVEKITQAILAKAFRGELVPTEAELARLENRSYEPASALLARIRTERSAGDDELARRKTSKAKHLNPSRKSRGKN